MKTFIKDFILVSNWGIGLFLATISLRIFQHMIGGGSWSEPDKVVLRLEFILAIIFISFFL